MKIFISWSGGRSKKTAEIFAEWLPQVIQAVDPWISSDIEKGSRWTPEISDRLESSKVGIICLTSENLNEKWILFEAGALSKVQNTKVCTILLGLTPADIEPPLSQFQHTLFQKTDIFKLIQTINSQVSQLNEKALTDKTLSLVFERCWPDLETEITKIVTQLPEKKENVRVDREILEEILEIVRQPNRNTIGYRSQTVTPDMISKIDAKFKRLINEFGVLPSEAKRSIINEMKKENFEDPERKIVIIDFIQSYY